MEVLLRRVGRLSFAERREALDRWTEELFGCRVERRANGAPYLECGVGLSVSHTGEWLALGVDREDGRVGVDIELADRGVERVARRFMRDEERRVAEGVYPKNPGLWVWCAKEALYKAGGREGVDWLVDLGVLGPEKGSVCGEEFRLGWREEEGLLVVWAY